MRNLLLIAMAVFLPVAVIASLVIMGEDSTQLVEKPKIWFCDRVLIPESSHTKLKDVISAFLNPGADLNALGRPIEPTPVEYSGGRICFEYAVRGDGWVIQWGSKYCHSGAPVEANCKEPTTCGVYFKGNGCSHCANTDPWMFYEFVPSHPIVLVEYEIYRNAEVFEKYASEYGASPGIPQIIFDREHKIVGDVPIIQELEEVMKEVEGACPVDWLKGAMEEE